MADANLPTNREPVNAPRPSRTIPEIREANVGQPGIETDDHGDPIGKDPRTIDRNELRALGHERRSPMQVIRAKCLECCCGSPSEVRACIITSCPNWPYRMGSNPWRAKKVLSPAQIEKLHSARKSSLVAKESERG
jgi:hypothetical protein